MYSNLYAHFGSVLFAHTVLSTHEMVQPDEGQNGDDSGGGSLGLRGDAAAEFDALERAVREARRDQPASDSLAFGEPFGEKIMEARARRVLQADPEEHAVEEKPDGMWQSFERLRSNST